MSALLEQHKRWCREVLQSDLHDAFEEIKAAHFGLSVEHLMTLLNKKMLWAEVQRVEAASAQRRRLANRPDTGTCQAGPIHCTQTSPPDIGQPIKK
jgi:hypothetical protein